MSFPIAFRTSMTSYEQLSTERRLIALIYKHMKLTVLIVLLQ